MPRRGHRNPAHPRNRPGAGEISPETRPGATMVLLVASVLVIGLLSYAVYPSLSPFVILACLLVLLYPHRGEEVPRRLLWLGVLLFAVWFLSAIIGVLAPFLIAFFLAYLLNPLVVWLEQRRVPRWVSTLAIVLLMIGAVVAFGLFIVPVAFEESSA
jgi:hypothetical protein